MLARATVRYRMPEMLRHTFASTMLSRNAPLLYVQTQDGWTSATVLLKHYSEWLPEAEGAPEWTRGDRAGSLGRVEVSA